MESRRPTPDTRANGEGEVHWVAVEDVAALLLHPGLRASWDELRTSV